MRTAMRESPISSYLRRRHLPLQATPVRLLGVDYAHLPTGDGGDLYVTLDGLHRLDYLLLENWWCDRSQARSHYRAAAKVRWLVA